WALRFPSGPMVLLQIGLGLVDLGATALAMYVLIPAEMNIGMFRAIAVFIAGILLGFASHAPAGLGAFDATILIGPGRSGQGRTADCGSPDIPIFVSPSALCAGSRSVRRCGGGAEFTLERVRLASRCRWVEGTADVGFLTLSR